MSMSNLASQLAGLNHKELGNKNVGSILAGSTRHDDAIGRGLHHSVQVGHSITHGSDPRFKPSLLYEDAKAASDVPLTTLWENCQAALEELSRDFYPPLQAYLPVCQETLLQRTKGSTTSLTNLLTILCTLIPHDNVNCLHVLEYLVRRYNIHMSAADPLLMILLPHAQAHARLFHRVLQLVNVTAAGGTWIWLRPYARADRTGKEPLVPLPRRVVVQHAIPNTALLQQVCSLTQTVAKLASNNNGIGKPHRGIQQILAWSATLMVQGLHYLQTVELANKESVLRVLLPIATAACASSSGFKDWTVWGHIVASSLAETMELAPPVQQCLCQAILKGVCAEDEDDHTEVMDALVAVASVCCLPGVDKAWNNATAETWKDCVAVPFPNVLQQIWKLNDNDILATALHQLYHERQIDVGGLITSLFVWAVLEQNNKNSAAQQFVTATLMKDEDMWKDEKLTEAFAEWLVWSHVQDDNQEENKQTKKKLVLYQELLCALRKLDAQACERGMAQAMLNKQDDVDNEKRLAALLEGVLPAPSKYSKEETTSTWLPPRVALEHADPALRLQAIGQLRKEHENKDNDDDNDVVMADSEELESLQEALGRRMASDEDLQVVLAAAKALKEILASNSVGAQVSNNVLAALYQWASFSSKKKHKNAKDEKKKKKIIVQCLTILGQAVNEEDNNAVLGALAAHLDHWNEQVVAAAAASLVKVMGEDPSESPVEQAKTLLVERGTDFCSRLVADSATETKEPDNHQQAMEVSLRRRSLWVMLQAMKDWIGQSSNDEAVAARIYQSAVDACLAVLSSSTEKDWKKNPERAQSLKDVWRAAVRKVASSKLPKLLVSLASLPKEKVYTSLGKELIEASVLNVKDSNGKAVSVYSVVLEAALQEGLAVVGVVRLLALAQDFLSGKDANGSASWYCVIPALALLEHSNESVRLASVLLLSSWKVNVSEQPKDAPYRSLASVCQEVSKKQSSATLGGLTFLPLCLADAVRETGDAVRDDLLSLCWSAVVACGSNNVLKASEMTESAWLSFGEAAGKIGAAVTLLRAMEHAGEAAFPLERRWAHVGAPILDKLLGTDNRDASTMPPALSLLRDVTVGMLKGVSVADSRSLDTVVISMGPSSTGRRQRSYSIGKSEGVTFVDEYPQEMVTAIVRIMKDSHTEENLNAQRLCSSVASKVLGREAWAVSVFSKFSSDQKREIAAEFLRILADSPLQISSSYFLSLPLDASDITFLRKGCVEKSWELAAVSVLADFIRSNDERLMSSFSAAKLVKTLFASLDTFSSPTRDDSDEAEFVRQAILSALLDLMSQDQKENEGLQIAEKEVSSFVGLLLSLNSNDSTAKDLRPLVSQRAKATSLSVLTKLCSRFPKPVVASLIPAIKTHIEATESVESEEKMTQHTRSTFASIVPVFLKYAPQAGLSFSHLLSSCVESARCVTSRTKRAGIYGSLVRAIASCSSSDGEEPSMGAVVASYFAGEVHAAGGDFKRNLQDSTEFALQIMYDSSGFAQVSSILLILHYADSLLLALNGDDKTPASTTSFDANDSYLPKAGDLIQLASTGALSSESMSSTCMDDRRRADVIMDLVQALLLTANDAMLMESVRKCIRRSDRNHTTLCLRLWQDLLILQSSASDVASTLDKDSEFAETIIRVSSESLDQIQNSMPLPTFLASATSLIKDGDTDELRAGAIRLVAERAPEICPGTPEALLFLEMASLLVTFLKCPEESPANKEKGGFLLQQSALVAIEHIAKASHQGATKEKASKNQDRTFLSALQGCADIFNYLCGKEVKIKYEVGDMNESSQKLLCSAALCTATLVRTTAPKCLAMLPKFMNQLVSSLSSVNALVLSTESDQLEILSDARMAQICLLRALASVAESVPQFIYPYLKRLLVSSALPSKALRGPDVDQNVRLAAEGLEKTLSTHVPVRVLLPVVSTAIASLESPLEFEVLLKLLKQSIDASSSEELVGHLSALLKAATTTYEYNCEFKVRSSLVDVANETVLALVMKLSENHLRRLYSDLREWRGGLDAEDPEELAMRRYAFWKVSAVLGKELRTIFLPCLSGVLADAIDELNLVVSHFCTPKKSNKTKDGKKKRRLDDAKGSSLGPNTMLSIQPLLSCLEFSFRGDAQDGGKWVRTDDGQRYRSLLGPLGLLLQSKVPSDFPGTIDDEGLSPFQVLVEGGAGAVSGRGSVVGCVTALASAAGNEQLWKPLNYAVLDACGNRGRSEVRKAGLACLLSLMKSLGEEYMVLLPECLPILAELLEDNDEEVAALAQDCISLGEELLGESLEDSLR